MSTGLVTRHLPYSRAQLFDLAADVERYPEYLPGWVDVSVLERSATHLLVRQQLGIRLLRQPFTAHVDLDRPRSIRVHAADGPFRELCIEWRFEPDDSGQCAVSLAFSFTLQSGFLAPMAEGLFEHTAPLIIERFEQRARQLYDNHNS